jgi:hypothetical protein
MLHTMNYLRRYGPLCLESLPYPDLNSYFASIEQELCPELRRQPMRQKQAGRDQMVANAGNVSMWSCSSDPAMI